MQEANFQRLGALASPLWLIVLVTSSPDFRSPHSVRSESVRSSLLGIMTIDSQPAVEYFQLSFYKPGQGDWERKRSNNNLMRKDLKWEEIELSKNKEDGGGDRNRVEYGGH
jgi:hypothetical protein